MCCRVWLCKLDFVYLFQQLSHLTAGAEMCTEFLHNRDKRVTVNGFTGALPDKNALLYSGSRRWWTQAEPCCSLGGWVGSGWWWWGGCCCQTVQSVANAYLKDLWPRWAGALHFTIMCAHIPDLRNLNSCCAPGGAARPRPTENHRHTGSGWLLLMLASM